MDEIRESKKINYEQCIDEEFKRKKYLSEMKLNDVRAKFKESSGMLETFKCNFSNKYKTKSLACDYCTKNNPPTDQPDEPRDNQQHALTECPQYSDLRAQFDTRTEMGIVNFFRSVIQRRQEEEEGN